MLNNALVLSFPEVARGGGWGGGLETWGNVGEYGDFYGDFAANGSPLSFEEGVMRGLATQLYLTP